MIKLLAKTQPIYNHFIDPSYIQNINKDLYINSTLKAK